MKNIWPIALVLVVTAVAIIIDITYRRLIVSYSNSFDYNFTLLTVMQFGGALFISLTLLGLFAYLQARPPQSLFLACLFIALGTFLLFAGTIQGVFFINNITPQLFARAIRDLSQSRILLTGTVGGLLLGIRLIDLGKRLFNQTD